jgi:hypothetical protein
MKKTITLTIFILLIIFLSYDSISLVNRDISPQRYEEVLQAIVRNPDNVVIRQNGRNVTSDFLDKYRHSIENNNYTEAINFLKKKGTDITISISDSNKFLLE